MKACPDCGQPVENHCWHDGEDVYPVEIDAAESVRRQALWTPTVDDDYAEELEDALRQAQSTVEFLHGCLTEPTRYGYQFPDMTARNLREWAKLAPRPPGCLHGLPKQGCGSCARHAREAARRAERHARADVREGEGLARWPIELP